jgi:hypothetical protein
MEAKLGRRLEKDETVEHRDGDGLNVEPENLIVVTRSVNTRLRHQREQKEREREQKERERERRAEDELCDCDMCSRTGDEIPWQDQF